MFGNDIFLCAKIDDTQSLLEEIDTIDLNIADEAKESLLHYAVRFNSIDFARLLLMHKANPNIKNANGDTPLMLACKMGKENFIKLLLKFNADINERNNFGETSIHMALLNGNIDIIRVLINEKTNLSLLTDSNRSIVHYAVKSGKISVLKYIIEKTNSSVNETDGLGNSVEYGFNLALIKKPDDLYGKWYKIAFLANHRQPCCALSINELLKNYDQFQGGFYTVDFSILDDEKDLVPLIERILR